MSLGTCSTTCFAVGQRVTSIPELFYGSIKAVSNVRWSLPDKSSLFHVQNPAYSPCTLYPGHDIHVQRQHSHSGGQPNKVSWRSSSSRLAKSYCKLGCISTVLIMLGLQANPHKRLRHLYGARMMTQYRGIPLGELSPHVYAIAEQVMSWSLATFTCRP